MFACIDNQITVIEIPSAAAMRERAEVRAEEIKREDALAKLAREAMEHRRAMERLEKMPEIIQAIVEDIHSAVEKGETCIRSETWYWDTVHWHMNKDDVQQLAPVIAEVMTRAGYYMSDSIYEYSKSWQNKSGKLFTWGYISWENK
jgi:septation ring formation regulator EzrA